jgi:hypothetical protein
VATFFDKAHTPIPPDESTAVDERRHRGVATMCFVYGVFVLAPIAQTWSDRLGLLFCGGFMVGVGVWIRASLRDGVRAHGAARDERSLNVQR